MEAVMDVLFEMVVSLWFARSYKREFIPALNSYTSTVTLRVVGGDEK
jgi:hypothetical protein